MMTNPAELIAEAESFAGGWDEEQPKPRDIGAAMELIDRLAAALRECAVPEGWTATEYVHGEVYSLKHPRVAQTSNGFWVATHRVGKDYPTASAAMAALDGEGK